MINQYSNYFNAFIFYLAFSISFNFHLYLNFPSIFQIQFKLCLLAPFVKAKVLF